MQNFCGCVFPLSLLLRAVSRNSQEENLNLMRQIGCFIACIRQCNPPISRQLITAPVEKIKNRTVTTPTGGQSLGNSSGMIAKRIELAGRVKSKSFPTHKKHLTAFKTKACRDPSTPALPANKLKRVVFAVQFAGKFCSFLNDQTHRTSSKRCNTLRPVAYSQIFKPSKSKRM